MTFGNDAPADATDELAFLARSRHRLQLLRRLSREERTRRELEEETGISQPTLGRILGDFERRAWARNHHDGAYTLGPLGRLLADEVEGLLDVFESVGRLAGVSEHVPWERLDFDLRHLASARVTTPGPAEPLAHMRRFDELVGSADRVAVLSNVLSCAPAHESGTADREFLADVDELVVTAAAVSTGLEDPEFSAWLLGRVDDGALSLYRHPGPVPYLLGLFDEVAGLVPIDDAGTPVGLIESDEEPVVAWVKDAFAGYRAAAARLGPDTLPSVARAGGDRGGT